MKYNYKFKLDSIDKFTQQVLNAYNFLHAVRYIYQSKEASTSEIAGAAAADSVIAKTEAETLTIGEYSTVAYFWQLIVNNLQTLPRAFTEQDDFTAVRTVFWPAGRTGDEGWYNRDRDILAHTENLALSYRQHGATGYFSGETARLLPVLEDFLVSKLHVAPDVLRPRLEGSVKPFVLNESTGMFSCSLAISEALKAEPKNVAHAQNQFLLHMRMLYKQLQETYGRQFELEDVATLNVITEILGNNLKQIMLSASENDFYEMRNQFAGDILDQRNLVAHSLQLKLVSKALLESVKKSKGVDTSVFFKVDHKVSEFASELSSGKLDLVASPAEAYSVVANTSDSTTKTPTSSAIEEEDDFAPSILASASAKPISTKKTKDKKSGPKKPSPKIEEDSSNEEFELLIDEMKKFSDEQDLPEINEEKVNRKVEAYKLSKKFIDILLPVKNANRTDLTKEEQEQLIEIVRQPYFNPFTKVQVFKMRSSHSDLEVFIMDLTKKDAEAAKSRPLRDLGIEITSINLNPMTALRKVEDVTVLREIIKCGLFNLDGFGNSCSLILNSVIYLDFVFKLFEDYPDLLAEFAARRFDNAITKMSGKIYAARHNLMEVAVLEGQDELLAKLIDSMNFSDIDIIAIDTSCRHEDRRDIEKVASFYSLTKISKDLDKDDPLLEKVKVTFLTFILLGKKMNKSVKKIFDKYLNDSFCDEIYGGKSLFDLITDSIEELGIAEQNPTFSNNLKMAFIKAADGVLTSNIKLAKKFERLKEAVRVKLKAEFEAKMLSHLHAGEAEKKESDDAPTKELPACEADEVRAAIGDVAHAADDA